MKSKQVSKQERTKTDKRERFEKKDKKKGCCLEREWREERERERERKRKEDQKVPKRNVHVPRAAFTAGEDGHE